MSRRDNIPGFGERNLLTPEGVLTFKATTSREFKLTEEQIAYVCLNNFRPRFCRSALEFPLL